VKKNDAAGGGHKWTLLFKTFVPADHHQVAYIIKGFAMKIETDTSSFAGSNSVAETIR
jgi:hypothetical protein